MKKHIKIWLGVLAAGAVTALTTWYLQRYTIDVLQPVGEIGTKERNLMAFCLLLSGIVVFPVFGMLGYFAWKYRESNKRAAYEPNLHGNNKLEVIWWLIPGILLVIISTITWRSSYALDPFKSLKSDKKTLHVQAVALDWKWLFIYPEQNIATVNYAMIPVDTPVEFAITSDTVMSSFWVPRLGGQMYAMPGMVTKLNLSSSQIGTYNGSTANISGKGFADMKFKVAVASQDRFDEWAKPRYIDVIPDLNSGTYAELAKPGTGSSVRQNRFESVDGRLYDSIVMKYMMPMEEPKTNTTLLEGASF